MTEPRRAKRRNHYTRRRQKNCFYRYIFRQLPLCVKTAVKHNKYQGNGTNPFRYMKIIKRNFYDTVAAEQHTDTHK